MPEFQKQAIIPPSEEYPTPETPTIFADGIKNLANTSQMAKFYLFRFDPSFTGSDRAKVRPCAQIVMSIDALTNAFAFLENAVKQLQVQGVISEQALETARKFVRDI
jgi:hypothetical protein